MAVMGMNYNHLQYLDELLSYLEDNKVEINTDTKEYVAYILNLTYSDGYNACNNITMSLLKNK